MINKLSKKHILYTVFILGFLTRLVIAVLYADNMYLYSDDMGYLNSGINLAKSLTVTYGHEKSPTFFIMPGLSLLLALCFKIAGSNYGILLAKIVFAVLASLTAYACYKIAYRFFNFTVAIFTAIIMNFLPCLLITNSLLLTETAFIFLLAWAFYFIIMAVDNNSTKYYVLFTLTMLLGLMFRAYILIMALFGIYYALINKIKLVKILKYSLYFIICMVLIVMPWAIRNYQIYNKVIPFTGNSGDLMFIGSFVGEGYPQGDKNKIIEEIKKETLIYKEQKLRNLKIFEAKEIIGKQRIKQWIKNNPLEFIKTHIYYKPKVALQAHFYKIEIFNLNAKKAHYLWNALLNFSLLGALIGLVLNIKNKVIFKRILYLIVCFIIMLLTSSSTYPMSRYVLPCTIFISMFFGLAVNSIKTILIKAQKIIYRDL